MTNPSASVEQEWGPLFEKFRCDLIDGLVVKESDGDPWGYAKEEARQIVEELQKRLAPLLERKLEEVKRQARLDEAKREWPSLPRDGKYLTLLQWVQGLDLLQRERIAELEAANGK